MRPRIENQGPELAESDIRSLEARLGRSLPADYRRFLLETNGGVPVPRDIETPGAAQQWSINVLLGLSRMIASSNIASVLDDICDTVPPGYLPVAVGDGGEIILLAIDGANVGSVVLWQWQEDDLSSRQRHLYPLAGSFRKFLGSFREL